ncbi:hypothetical protein FSP39_000443 [Pinctada imbricata]|uniref:Cadherin domain-containing protein n=1 Tax=Pinctada imbricata TaxID=66713 RepID=A0AA88XT32_PINIB|nr:hypothetical protein FSP39_000443 [Pinctada imbricata]
MILLLLGFFFGFVSAAPPDLSASLPDSINVLESAAPSVVTSLLDITVTDPEGDTYSCNVAGASSAFNIQNTAANTESLYLINNPGFEHDTTSSYTLTVTCIDTNSESASGTITANILQNTPPTITGLTGTVTIGERETTVQKIADFTVTDSDAFSCNIYSTTPASAPFNYQATPSRAIWLNANPGLDASVTSTYTITVRCLDSYGFSSGTVTVNVVPNSAPVITGLPTTVPVKESVAGGSNIYSLTVSDPEGDSFTCSDGISPSTSDIYLDSATNQVMLAAGHSLEYDVQSSYVMTIICNDGSKSTSGTVTIEVQPNNPPSISNLPATSTVTEGEAGGRNLITLTVTDAETDPVTCSITTTGPFSISGLVISVNAAPSLNFASTPSYSIPVTCRDDYGSTTETFTVNVVANTAPVISGLPTSVSVQESDAGGSSIYTLTVSDSNSFSCVIQSTSPAVAPFTIVFTTQYDINLNNGHGLDYDTTSSYSITIACNDGSLTSTGQLNVAVIQNAPPAITSLPDLVSITTSESAKRKLHDLAVTETDPYTCSMTGGGPFSLEKEVSGYKIYLDAGASSSLNYPTISSYSLNVTCADAYGSSSAVLNVAVSPNAAPSFSNLPAAVSVVESDAGGSSIFTVTVTDAEGDSFSCSITSVTPAVTAFQISPNAGNYDINLVSGHALEYDTATSHSVVVECTDGTASTGTLTVNVSPNSPPAITSLPAVVTVTIGETAARTLHSLVVADAETDPFVCTMTSNPTGGPFSLSHSTAYTVDLNSNPTFGGATSYTLSIKCEDSYGSSSKDLTVKVDPNTDPVINAITGTNTVIETETAARCFLTVDVTDVENHVISCSVVTNPSGPFEMQQDASVPEYKICLMANAIATLDATVATSHIITVTCTDTAGGSTSSDVTVFVTANNPPAITGLPDTVEISENLQVETKIWDLAVTDPDGDVFTCELITSPTGPFDLRKDAGTGVYSAYVLSTPNLNYTVAPSYDLTFNCTDYPKGRSTTNVLTVDVVENRPPQFDNTPYTATPNAMSTVQNDVIFTVTASDLDLDSVLYSMTVSPSLTSTFAINTVTGEISATSDLKYQLTKTFIANVTATDGKKSVWELVTIDLQNLNTAPIISNMVLNGITSVYIPETTASGSTLFTATVYDPDGGQTQTISVDVSPSGMTGTFSENNYVISLANGKTFDYETLRYYRLALYVSDTFTQTGPYYLAVNILDEPEDCVFPKTNYRADTYEGGKGSVSIDIGLEGGVTDEDHPDPRTFSLVTTAHSNLFNISSTTGVIYYAVDYDIDVSHPQNLSLIVKCTDKYGLTATATVSLYIADINDNAPQCNNAAYAFAISQYSEPGNEVGTVTATDLDQNLNARFDFSGSSATGSGYFSVAKTGQVFLTRSVNYDYGITHRFRVLVKDHGAPQLTGTCWVDITYREVTTTTPTTTTVDNTDWWDKPENVAMVAILSALALLLLALLLYFCLRACGKPTCPHFPKKTKPEKFKLWDANDLNKKRDPYSTAAQKEMDAMPEPMVL